ncbi:MAG: hypothetical protein AB1689_11230 [Thermodesulfobacteriota bacterium]
MALALEVEPRDGGSCARAEIATDVDPRGEPAWLPIAFAECFAAPLGVQGVVADDATVPGPVLFAGTRLWIDGRAAEPDLRPRRITDRGAT